MKNQIEIVRDTFNIWLISLHNPTFRFCHDSHKFTSDKFVNFNENHSNPINDLECFPIAVLSLFSKFIHYKWIRFNVDLLICQVRLTPSTKLDHWIQDHELQI